MEDGTVVSVSHDLLGSFSRVGMNDFPRFGLCWVEEFKM